MKTLDKMLMVTIHKKYPDLNLDSTNKNALLTHPDEVVRYFARRMHKKNSNELFDKDAPILKV